LSSSFDSLLSRASRDVFTGSTAQSVQALWPIKSSPTTAVAGAGVKGFDYIYKLQIAKMLHQF